MISDADRALLLGQVVALERGGTPLAEAVRACRDAATAPEVRRALAKAAERLEAGDAPSAAFAAGGLLEPGAAALVRAGEEAEAATEALERAAGLLSLRHRTRRSLQDALTYPLCLALAAGALALFGGVILRTYMAELREVTGTPAQVTVALPLGIALVVGATAALVLLRRFGPWGLPLVVPLAGAGLRRGVLANVVGTAGAAMRHGVTPEKALRMAAAAASGDAQRRLARAAGVAAETGRLAESLERAGCATAQERIEIAAAEEAEDPARLEELGRRLTGLLEARVDRFLRLAWPFAVIAVGLITFGLIYSTFGPIYELANSTFR